MNNRVIDVASHSLLVEPRRHAQLRQAVVNAFHTVVVVAPELVIGPVVRQEDLCRLQNEGRSK